MVLVMPILVVVLALLFYYGRDVVRVQRASVMDRYETWRQVGRAPGPPAGANAAIDERQMNQMFFGGNAASIDADVSGYFPPQVRRQLEEAASEVRSETGLLARLLFEDLLWGRRIRFEVHHEEPVAMWRRWHGPIRHGHTRMEHEWRYANGWRWVEGRRWKQGIWDRLWQTGDPADDWEVADSWQSWPPHSYCYQTGPRANNLPAVRDAFFTEFESRLDILAQSEPTGSAVAMIRDLYLATPRYFGPAVGFE